MNLQETEDRYTSGLYSKRPIVLVRGRGARVWDADGREYIDCTAGIGVAALGHAHPVVVEAIARQAARLITCHELFYNDERARLLERLAALLPASLNRFFLCNSGTEANEAAIKFARLATGRQQVVAAMRGFHGKTFGSLSATWDKKYREPFEPLVPGFRFMPFDDPQAVEAAVTGETAAAIVEVVQGEGGVRPGSTAFFAALGRRCRDVGALLIVDEIQTGFGRTGRMFAFEHHDCVPDILTMAKAVAGGLPMGVVAFGDAVGSLPKQVHSTTFGGSPLVCAVARRVIDVLVDERLPERAASGGAAFLAKLKSMPSSRVREVRGLGLMVGIELKEKAGPYARALMDEGVLVLLAGTNVLRLLPPLVIDAADLAIVADTLAKVLA